MRLVRTSFRFSTSALLAAGVLSLLLTPAFAQTAPDPVLGSTKLAAGIPTGPSPDKNNQLYGLNIFYFNADNSLGKSVVDVPNIPVTAGLPNPTPAQILAARTAKAAAIVDAINKAKLNGVTATVDPNDPTQYTVSGVRQSIQTYKFPKPGTPGTYLGPSVIRTNRVTGETGNVNFNFNKNPGGGGGTGSSMYQGTMMSVDSNISLSSSGQDYSGFTSQVGFGFIDYTVPSSPINHFVNMPLSPGMSDSQILSLLSTQFNTAFSSSGYTTTFDPSTGWLSINQPLSPNFGLYTTDTDTVLDFQPNLIDVPEPASAFLLAAASSLLLLRRNRK